MMNTFRYGNLADEKVYVDYFTQYNLGVSRARESFARVAKEFIRRGDNEKAIELLDRGLKVLPTSQIRYTEANTYPFIEAYYAIGEGEKGDALLVDYAEVLIEYIEHYLRFDGVTADLVSGIIDEKFDELSQLYYLAGMAQRYDVVAQFNEYYRSFGAEESDLIQLPEEYEPKVAPMMKVVEE